MKAMTDLADTLDALSRDVAVSVVVLTGGVPGYFVAHADLDDLARIGRGEPFEGDPGSWARAFGLLASMPQPVVAAVNGQAWGGGCELSLACTLRVAAQSAHFGQPEVNVGIIPGAGGTQRLPRLVGMGRAAELVLSGRIIDANEAERIGLVNEGFVDHVLEWVAPIASKPKSAIAAAKRALIDGIDLPLAEGLRIESQLFIQLQRGAEAIALEEAALDRYHEANDTTQVEL
jgi:enoyl-CoA hydratase